MVENGNVIVTHFEGSPDMWNSKPPLMIWLQALFIKAFGINELAVRLPAALAAFFTALSLFFFCSFYLKSIYAGLISGMVLVTTPGFIYSHVARHGEYDALLIFFITLASLLFFIYSENPVRNYKYLYLFALMVFLAAMTKGIAAFVFLPGLLLYSLFRLKIREMLLSKHLYINILLVVVSVCSYYILREQLNPGYIDAVINNEIGGRYLEVNEGHHGSFWYYFNEMLKWAYVPWIYFLIPASFLILWNKSQTRRIGIYFALWIISFFLIISSGETKLTWYAAPIYPIAALIIGIGCGEILQLVSNNFKVRDIEYYFLTGVMVLIIFPYINIIKTIKTPLPEYSNEMKYRDYLRYVTKEYPDSRFVVANRDYNGHLYFYIKQINKKGGRISYNRKLDNELSTGDKVVTCDYEMKEKITNKYNFIYLHQGNDCETYLILPKSDSLSNNLQ